jgi:hypothetical protein
MEEELQPAKYRLAAPAHKGQKVRGAQEPVAIDGAQELAIAPREEHAAHRRALESRPASL